MSSEEVRKEKEIKVENLKFYTNKAQKLINLTNDIEENKNCTVSIKICLRNTEYEIIDEQDIVESILKFVNLKSQEIVNKILKEIIPKILIEGDSY